MSNTKMDGLESLTTIFEESYHIPLDCSPFAPLDGKEVTLENSGELNKEFYELEEEGFELSEKSLINVTLNGGKIYLVSPKSRIKTTDSLMDIVTYKYPKTWHMLFSEQLQLFEHIDKVFSAKGYENITPHKKDMFKAFYLTPLHSIKVVIIASEPINRPGEATGLAFGNYKGADKTLKEIYKEIYRNFEATYKAKQYNFPGHGKLDEWARRGVLLLNLSLTAEIGVKGAHKDLWLPFTRRVIDYISKENQKVIYMLWGGDAKFIKDFIPSRHVSMISSHPLFKGPAREPFVGSNHFYNANMILLEDVKTEAIKWSLTE